MIKMQKSLFTSLTLLSVLLLTTGCAPKNPDGSYASVYSYHPYLKYNHAKKTDRPYRPSQNRIFRHTRPSNHIVTNIEKTAKSLLGTDYQYGADGPNHYDCSGFTKYVFSKEGIRLPRVSREQAKIGQFVTANQLQKGDLIFFDSKKSPRISHVGIYLGEGNFIHASSVQDKVTISNLHSNYYAKHFKWGRRLTHLNYARR
jgi:cell wall-associated NlpC family hydrolase